MCVFLKSVACPMCQLNLCVCSSAESEELAVHLYPGAVTVQGVLRRKTVLKEGKKPTVRSVSCPENLPVISPSSPFFLNSALLANQNKEEL